MEISGQQASLFATGTLSVPRGADDTAAPFHAWFPLLEGCSPRLVRRLRRTWLPDASAILDPFAGAGTTPIVLARDGLTCGYAEANPALERVTGVKLDVLDPACDRAGLARRLFALADDLPGRLTTGDASLRVSYAQVFGGSTFFTPEVLARVLQLRTLNDALAAEDDLLGRCFSVAVMASLLPCSKLKRAGDVRYKTEAELARGVPSLLVVLRQQLIAMATDIAAATPAPGRALRLAADARTLGDLDDAPLYDGVIASPPYLNGTNYIRNARLELWYLRRLVEKADLRRLRDAMISAGINDVSAQTTDAPVTAGVAEVVGRLAETAYDARIAKMVGGYFFDMRAVLSGLRRRVKPGGAVCIDIGDSAYAGVHVPTDALLADIAEDLGYTVVERTPLRRRRSKGEHTLQQVLLVLRAPARQRADAVAARWSAFCRDMPHQQAPFSKRNWGSPLHSLCSYQGKLKPSLAHHLVQVFSEPGELVVDPFSGAGTVPFEACVTGRQGAGIDLSRLGYVLTRAKVAVPERAAVAAEVAALEAFLKTAQPTAEEHASAAAVSFNSAIPDYFHADTLREVLLARRFLQQRWSSSDAWAFTMSCCLHILHGNRPYALSRRSHPITPFAPTGPTEYRPLIPRLNKKIARALAHWEPTGLRGISRQGDCAADWGLPRPADAVITSPPFFDSTRFYMTNWMRYWFTGWERSDFDDSIGDFFETRQKKSLDIYTGFFEQARRAMRSGGYLVMHLGLSRKCDMGAELAARLPDSFEHIGTFIEGVEHCESHGVRDKGTVKGHAYLVARRR